MNKLVESLKTLSEKAQVVELQSCLRDAEYDGAWTLVHAINARLAELPDAVSEVEAEKKARVAKKKAESRARHDQSFVARGLD